MRRLAIGDEAILRELRLRAMTDAPDAFGSTLEREAARSLSDWQGWFAPGAVFVAEDASQGPIGLVAGMPDEDDPTVAHLMALWVEPSSRGSGTSDALVGNVIAWAESEGAGVLRLRVLADNAQARSLYARHGFFATGIDSVRERDGAIEIEMQRG